MPTLCSSKRTRQAVHAEQQERVLAELLLDPASAGNITTHLLTQLYARRFADAAISKYTVNCTLQLAGSVPCAKALPHALNRLIAPNEPIHATSAGIDMH